VTQKTSEHLMFHCNIQQTWPIVNFFTGTFPKKRFTNGKENVHLTCVARYTTCES